MQLFVLIMKQVYQMNEVMKRLAKAGVKGATILEGTGMAEALMSMEDLPILGVLKRVLEDGTAGTSQVMLVVLKDEQIMVTREIIKEVVGDLNVPNSGIMFALPITFVEGLGK